MTGEWEAKLKRIERGEGDFAAFMKGIEEYVRAVVGARKTTAAAKKKADEAGGRSAPPSLTTNAAARSPRSQTGLDSRRAEAAFGKTPAEEQARPPAAARPEAAERAPAPPGSLLQVLRESFGFKSFRPHQEDVCREGDGRTRCPAGHAHRRREIALLPIARNRARRRDAGCQPAHCVDGRPSRQAAGAGLSGRAHPFGTQPRAVAPSLPRLPRRQPQFSFHRARAAKRRGLPGDAGEGPAGADRDRRGSLHFPMGARFPPRIPQARRTAAEPAPRAGDRSDGDGNPQSPGRHRGSTRPAKLPAFDPRLPPRKHRHRACRIDAHATAAGVAQAARRTRPPPGHRLCPDAQGRRGASSGIAGPPAGRPPTTRA